MSNCVKNGLKYRDNDRIITCTIKALDDLFKDEKLVSLQTKSHKSLTENYKKNEIKFNDTMKKLYASEYKYLLLFVKIVLDGKGKEV